MELETFQPGKRMCINTIKPTQKKFHIQLMITCHFLFGNCLKKILFYFYTIPIFKINCKGYLKTQKKNILSLIDCFIVAYTFLNHEAKHFRLKGEFKRIALIKFINVNNELIK